MHKLGTNLHRLGTKFNKLGTNSGNRGVIFDKPSSRVSNSGKNVEDRGNAPSTHTGRLSENGMRSWDDWHMGMTHPVMRPIYARCVEGRCPYFDILPLQGAIPFKPFSLGENPGCRSLRSLYPGLRYHCPYRAQRPQNLRIITEFL